MNLLSSHTEDVTVIPCLIVHLLHKMPSLSWLKPNHLFQARNCRETTHCPQQKSDNITSLKPRDWPNTTNIVIPIYGTISGLLNLSATSLLLNLQFENYKTHWKQNNSTSSELKKPGLEASSFLFDKTVVNLSLLEWKEQKDRQKSLIWSSELDALELTIQMSSGMAPGTEWPLAPGALFGQPLTADFSSVLSEMNPVHVQHNHTMM